MIEAGEKPVMLLLLMLILGFQIRLLSETLKSLGVNEMCLAYCFTNSCHCVYGDHTQKVT